MRKSFAVVSAVSALAAASPALAVTNFFTNFDSVSVASGSYVILPTVEGWTATLGAGIEVQNNAAGAPFSSPNLVELDSTNNTEMSRLIDAGNYTLSFWYSPRPGQPLSTNGIQYGVDGVLNGAVALGGIGNANTVWQQYTVNFLTNTATTLRFRASGTSDSLGGYLDNIRLVGNPVPEATTWAMMLAGFAAAGVTLRRRRAVRAVSLV
jgi:hypothetical protein